MSKRAKFNKTLLFWKEKIPNWLETLCIKWYLWEILFYLHRERLRAFTIQDLSYDCKKNDEYRQKGKNCMKKFARKRCPSQLTLSCSLKTLKILHWVSLMWKKCESNDAHYWNTVKRKKTYKKEGKYAKITNFFMKTGCTMQKDRLRKTKPLWTANCISLDKGRDLSLEMLSYKITS